MRNRITNVCWAAAVCLLALSGITFGQKTVLSKRRSPQAEQTAVSREENLIRMAYKKLEVYNFASKLRDRAERSDAKEAGKALRFQLTKFKIGKIDDVKDLLYKDVVDLPTFETVQLVSQTIKMNEEEDGVGFGARWVPGQHATMFDQNWTMGDVLRIEVEKYYGVSRYASYNVTVSLDNKVRTYSAIVLFHGEPDDFKLEFWDVIVGMGGTLTRVWEEQRMPYGFRRRANTVAVSPSGERFATKIREYLNNLTKDNGRTDDLASSQGDANRVCCISRGLADFWEIDTCSKPQKEIATLKGETDESPLIADIPFYSSDDTGHISGTGVHHGRARFRPSCTALPDNQQSCDVQIRDQGYGDTESNHSDFYYHRGTSAESSRGNLGARGRTIECDAAIAFAFNSCLFPGCDVTITLSISGHGMGASASVSGGNLWRTARAQGNSCTLPRDSTGLPGGCNESAEFGCMSGFIDVGGTCVRSPTFASQCSRYGSYDFESCACSGGCTDGGCSPIVVDVLGNGFNLTGPSTGVIFDMEGNGTAAQFSWTASNSDDAWLAMDRNNNGRIDSGKELFGNITPQDIHPEGVERNGFLALALYDSPAYGGNADGAITQLDSVFARLRLWKDENHNGVSESCELFTLPDLGLEKIDLDFRSSKRVDENGNEFRYRSKVRDLRQTDISRWAWDVFLVKQP